MNTQTSGALPSATRNAVVFIAVITAVLALLAPTASAQVLVGDVSNTGFEGWTDTFVGTPAVGSPPNWGVLLGFDNGLSESSDGRAGDGPGNDDGLYTPYIMVNTTANTPATYDISATLSTYDNDGMGLVFGYQDNDNYFRVGLRAQSPGNVGFTTGLSVQKVVGGVITQLDWDGGWWLPATDGFPQVVELSVDGADWAVTFDGTTSLSGTDADLQAGLYGVHSWAQKQVDGTQPQLGTVLQSISVSSATLNHTTNFAGAIPAAWRTLQMVNSDGAIGGQGEDLGNFRQDFRNGTIQDDTNGYEWATLTAPNTDFIGPAVVIDEPGSAAWSNYQMKVRMENGDNDGIGLLVRVADDDTFYRISFSQEPLFAAPNEHQRAPRGMSLQKFDQGVWTELFRDDQENPRFLYTSDTPFDVIVSAVDDTMQVKVIDDPDGAANVYSYDPIVDSSSPILGGSVGFTNWGSGDVTNGITYSAFGGDGEILLETIDQIIDVQATLDRSTGNITLTNLGFGPVDIHGYSILSTAGSLDSTEWTPVTDNYDEPPPGDGSVDANDPWTVVTETNTDLTEAELSGGDGGTIGISQTVDLGDAWIKSRIEDVTIQLELANGSITLLPVNYTGTPYERSDLNTDGAITAADWLLFYPNTLADLSSHSLVEQALAGDLDGDGDNDVIDFDLFKADFEAANGVGSFDQMLAGVPEPSGLILLLIGTVVVCSFRKRFGVSGRKARSLASLAIALFVLQGVASAVDFTTFTVENYKQQNTFPLAIWDVTPTTASILAPDANNAGANVFYGTEDILNSRIFGTLVAGTDDDMVGLALGFNPGDTTNLAADFLLIDWKGVDQTFDFVDVAGEGLFHDLTVGQLAPAGLALSRVSGIPTADELWGHVAIADNPDGGVTELARGATLGSSRYPGNNPVSFDITYTPTEVTVSVDGVEQFNVSGTFGSGRLGLYTLAQSPTPIFSDFEIISLDQVLTATVHRDTGEIVLNNQSAFTIDFDYYQFDSASGSLGVAGWTSLDDADGAGVGWDEAGGSDSTALGELYLEGSTELAPSASVSIGNAYQGTEAADEDLELTLRLLPFEIVLEGNVEYINEYPAGLGADFDNDGDIDGDDFLAWQEGFGITGGAPHGAGDADGDGAVNGADLAVWKGGFGSGGVSGGLGSGTAVPEPGTVGLIAVLMAALFCFRAGLRNFG